MNTRASDAFGDSSTDGVAYSKGVRLGFCAGDDALSTPASPPRRFAASAVVTLLFDISNEVHAYEPEQVRWTARAIF